MAETRNKAAAMAELTKGTHALLTRTGGVLIVAIHDCCRCLLLGWLGGCARLQAQHRPELQCAPSHRMGWEGDGCGAMSERLCTIVVKVS